VGATNQTMVVFLLHKKETWLNSFTIQVVRLDKKGVLWNVSKTQRALFISGNRTAVFILCFSHMAYEKSDLTKMMKLTSKIYEGYELFYTMFASFFLTDHITNQVIIS
jgi:hypothetical protein